MMPSAVSIQKPKSILLSAKTKRLQRIAAILGESLLFGICSLSTIAVLFIFYFIARDAIPFFKLRGFAEFFTRTNWYPAADPASFGALPIFLGSGLVTLAAAVVAVTLGVSAAVCLSDVLPFGARQVVKPVIEILAAIPSVAYGFFALVIFAPLLQRDGGHILAIAWWVLAIPFFGLLDIVLADVISSRLAPGQTRTVVKYALVALIGLGFLYGIHTGGRFLAALTIASGTNALNVSIILGIMALPTVVSVSEDSLQAVGRELREGSYALGATRAETMLKTILPAASSGICAAVILGIMRTIGETMVVWMASGNAAQIPHPWFNLLEPVRTLTATIAGDMGEADHVTGSARYHVLFAMGLCLLAFSFVCNLVSESVVKMQRKKLKG